MAVGQTLRATDYDGDGKSDLTTFRPSSGTSYVLKSSGGFNTDQIWIPGAISTDIPAPGDYDGDGKTDAAYFRPSTGVWQIVKSSTNFTTTITVTCGVSGDLPVPGDYDGDGKTDVAVFHRATGVWTIVKSSDGTTMTAAWGMWSDIPVPGDYDGDGHTDLAVFHPSTGQWQILYSSTGTSATIAWGSAAAGDIPVPGDYDGDGKTDLATYRPWDATHQHSMWWVLESHANYTTQWGLAWGAPTDIPVPGDYDGDGKTDLVTYRPTDPASGTTMWFALESHAGYTTQWSHSWGGPNDQAGPNIVYANSRIVYAGPKVTEVTRNSDVDRDGRSDLTVFRPSSGLWLTRTSLSNYATQTARQWGTSADIPVPGDYDGDGKTDPAYYRPSTNEWHILQSSTNYAVSVTITCGVAGDLPVPGDYDGDGKTDVAIFHPATAQWQIVNSRDGTTTTITFGTAGDLPAPADYDGDGRVDAAVYRPSNGLWLIRNSSNGVSNSIAWGGASTDIPVAGDYDGDGQADLATFRAWDPTQQKTLWWVLESHAGFTTQWNREWGTSTDVPVPGDYDGDGKMDLAVYRPSTGQWLILQSSSNYTTSQIVTFGATTDVAVDRENRVLQPMIASLSPTSGLAGTSVTITGTNFGASQGTSSVSFGGVTASPTSWSASSIVVPVPASATSGDVVATVSGLASNSATFAVPPTIVSLSPSSGATGTLITIAGTHFGRTQETSVVTFNGVPASVAIWSDTSVVVFVPATATTGSVVVTVLGSPTNSVTFAVVEVDRTPPVVTITSPAANTTVSTASLAVTGIATDDQSAIQGATCNGATATVSSGNVNCAVTLVPGSNVILMQATDTAGNVASASAVVTLQQQAPTSIALVPATRSLAVGETATLSLLDNAGLVVTNATWSSANTSEATVDANGLVTALAVGQTIVTATAGSLSAQTTVTIYPAGALPVGTVRWSSNAPPASAGSCWSVGVSGMDGTSVAQVCPNDSTHTVAIQGSAVDGRPTWSLTVPIGASSLASVAGDVSGGVLLSAGSSLTRVDSQGANWRFSAPSTVSTVAQASDGTVFVPITGAIVVLDGRTGQQKFAVPLAKGTLRGNGEIAGGVYLSSGAPACGSAPGNWPSVLHSLVVDAKGLANALVETAVMDHCGPFSPGFVPPQLDVSLYRISASGAVSVVPLRHYDGTFVDNSFQFPRLGLYPGVLPDDEGGVVVTWNTCSLTTLDGCDTKTARYIDANGNGPEYPSPGILMISGSGHRGYSVDSLNHSSVNAFDMTSGQTVLVPTSATPSVALEGGQLMLEDLNSSIIIGPDGSTVATNEPKLSAAFPILLVGDTAIGRVSADLQGPLFALGRGASAFADQNSFAQGGGNASSSRSVRTLGTGIFAKSYQVAQVGQSIWYHIGLKLIPENQQQWRTIATVTNPVCYPDIPNGHCFVNQEEGNYFMTISAEISPYPGCGTPTPGSLTLHYNWPGDVLNPARTDYVNSEPERLRYDRTQEDFLIAKLFSLTANYVRNTSTVGGAVPYFCFPETPLGSGKYNSNSFMKGLLREAVPTIYPDVPFPLPLLNFADAHPSEYPGWLTPVPSSKFH